MEAPIVLLIKSDIYPYTRTTRKQKFLDRQYQLYNASKKEIGIRASAVMREQDRWPIPHGIPLRLGIILQMARALHKRDLSNQAKAIEDSLQRIVFANDAWVDQSYQERFLGPRDLCLVVIEPLAEAAKGDWIKTLRELAREHGLVVPEDNSNGQE